jgi:hypothetical protein
MRRKNFVLSAAAAAVLAAFNPGVNAGANISPGVNVGSGDQSMSSSASANQSSTDINSSSTIDQSASSSQSSGVGFGHSDMQLGGITNPNVGLGATGDQSASSSTTANQSSTDMGSSSTMNQSARGHDENRAKGLDRADQVAGDHGRHGRDNAREKQGLN